MADTADRREGGIAFLRSQLAPVVPCIAAVLLVFALGVGTGIGSPAQAEVLFAAFAEWVRGLQDLEPIALMLAIFVRNAIAVGTTILFGLFLGFGPLIAALGNGLLMGYVLALGPGDAWKLIPHGLFELPAVFIGWGLGLWCGLWLFHPPRWATLRARLGRAWKLYFILILPLLAVAAMIEGALFVLLA